MTRAEIEALIAECLRREGLGLKIPIVLPSRKNPPMGRRVRVVPGLMGELACVNADGRIVVYVDAAKLRGHLEHSLAMLLVVAR